MLSYARRTRYVARIFAGELAVVLGGILGGRPSAAYQAPSRNRYQRVHADTLFREMGVTIQ